MTTIGLVGIGLVGAALARRLIGAGFAVSGFDIAIDRVAVLRELGGTAAPHVEDALQCDIVLLALFDDMQIRDVLQSARCAGTTIIDTGTGDPYFARTLVAELQQGGIAYVDAPLLGSSAQIAAGEAQAMLGGDIDSIARAMPIIESIASRSWIFGGAGQGRAAKLASNLILGLNRAAFAEGLAFAESLGIEPSSFARFIADSPARSAAAKAKAQRMLARDYVPESRIRQHHKDLALIEAAALRHGVQVPLTNAHRTLLDAAIAAGDGDLDNAAIIEEYRRRRSAPVSME